MMKNLALLLLIGLFSSQLVAQQTVRNFRLKNLDNRTTSFESLKGEELTVIDFWATWCKPCLKSLPKLVEMRDEFESQGVNFVGISIDGPRNLAKVKPFARSLGVDYPVLLDINSEMMAKLGVRAVPSLLIINKKNEIVYFHEGYKAGEEARIREELQRLLEE